MPRQFYRMRKRRNAKRNAQYRRAVPATFGLKPAPMLEFFDETGQDLMVDAPSPVPEKQLRDLHIKLRGA